MKRPIAISPKAALLVFGCMVCQMGAGLFACLAVVVTALLGLVFASRPAAGLRS